VVDNGAESKMEKLPLGNSGRDTTRLGFGCSSLMGAVGRRESLAILEHAFDAGIRHFDVAPMYGYGEAESCLGDFLKRHRAEVTVTTKYGIPPAKNSSLIRFARNVIGPVVKSVPGIKQRLARVADAATRNEEKASFTPGQAQASLDRSLGELRTDHIDVWLLHEVEAGDLRDDRLMTFLEDQVRKGTIGAFGIGSEGSKVNELLANRPSYCQLLQYEWSVLDAPIPRNQVFRIHHRALTNNFRSLHQALMKRADVCKRWSSSTGAELSDAKVLAHLMLRASLLLNPASVILFSSKKPEHILANVRVSGDISLDDPARKLYTLVQAERGTPWLRSV
jgi:D-threo-aldose 1-dehydrogenase